MKQSRQKNKVSGEVVKVNVTRLPDREKKPWWKEEITISGFAFIISVAAVSISTIQCRVDSKLLRETEVYYRKQVLPQLDFNMAINYQGIALRVNNWGTGVAIIDNIRVWLDSEEILDEKHASILLIALNKAGLKSSEYNFATEIVSGTTIAVGYGYPLITRNKLITKEELNAFAEFLRRIEIQILYHTVYDENFDEKFIGAERVPRHRYSGFSEEIDSTEQSKP